MGLVTACMVTICTNKSGHQFTPMAVSVCITPAAPSPVPVPYPVTGNSGEGIHAPAMRTKVNGAKVLNVGAAFKACHGNEPGTMKETMSFNTGGKSFIVAGAPSVVIERGFAGVTGSPGFLNKGAAGT